MQKTWNSIFPKIILTYKYYVIHTNLFIINLFMFLLQVRFFSKLMIVYYELALILTNWKVNIVKLRNVIWSWESNPKKTSKKCYSKVNFFNIIRTISGLKYLYLFSKKVNRIVFEKIRISEKFWAAQSAAQKFSDKFFKIFPKIYAQKFSENVCPKVFW